MKFGNIEDKTGIDFTFEPIPELTEKVLSTLSSKETVRFHFGAPVWSDKNYKGTLYPPKTPIKNFLKAYSEQFNSIEVNATRYGTPKESTILKWLDETPDDFTFSMKFPQVITHRKNIMEDAAKEQLERFLVALDLIGDKNGVAFAVMANYFRPDKFSVLEEFVKYIPRDIAVAIELRAPEWFESESIKNEWHQLFLENNIIPVLTDTPGRRDVLHFRVVNQHLFVRFVGNVGTSIDEIRINNWAKRIIDLTNQGITDVWFYAHVPGESREDVVPFNNQLISTINKNSSFDIPLLKDYRSSVLF
ncbi:MAG: DUF72 domain-containing protein [Flavobacteriales bacterium]|jgi:uncharacterized protein YecE (DUF72 family)|nr:DUF72 domain-containing protein [Flavobacteriales bacterium]